MKKCQLCGDMFTNLVKIKGQTKNLCNRKFCLKCSPFNAHNTKNLSKAGYNKKCAKCNMIKNQSEFYPKTGYCKKCSIRRSIDRGKNMKNKLVKYKGGKCCICGYHSSNSALEFHHIDSSKKDFSFSKVSTKQFSEITKQELDKCILLCSNCHREEHDKMPPLRIELKSAI